jgi:predicted ester cyclase
MRDKKSTLLYQWFEEVWNQNQSAAINTLMAHNANAHGILPDDHPNGAEGFKAFHKEFNDQYENIKVDVIEVVSEDDMECGLTEVTATHRDTGKAVKFSGLCMIRKEGKKIAEAWNHYDFLGMYQQLGHVLTAPAAQAII